MRINAEIQTCAFYTQKFRNLRAYKHRYSKIRSFVKTKIRISICLWIHFLSWTSARACAKGNAARFFLHPGLSHLPAQRGFVFVTSPIDYDTKLNGFFTYTNEKQ